MRGSIFHSQGRDTVSKALICQWSENIDPYFALYIFPESVLQRISYPPCLYHLVTKRGRYWSYSGSTWLGHYQLYLEMIFLYSHHSLTCQIISCICELCGHHSYLVGENHHTSTCLEILWTFLLQMSHPFWRPLVVFRQVRMIYQIETLISLLLLLLCW